MSTPIFKLLRVSCLVVMLVVLAISTFAAPPAPTGTASPTPTPGPVSPGGGMISPNVAIITISGPIDRITLSSVQRRIAAAEAANADAIVFDIDTPGGELMATRAICSAIKKTTVKRTIAWVNPDAISAGAIISLACQEIVVADAATFGDAAPIKLMPGVGLQSMGDTERSKMVAPIITELVDSARRNGWDEKLVQGIASRGAELWHVQNITTGKRIFIDRAEYILIFGKEPTAGAQPAIPSATDAPAAPKVAESTAPSDPKALRPAIPMTESDVRQTNAELAVRSPESTRPILTAADKGQWKELAYVTDGRGILTFRDQQMQDFGLASAKINSDDQLKAYTGATKMGRLEPAWYEGAARFMSNMYIRGALVVIIILGIFIEMVHPGLIAPGAIAALALLGLLLPGMLTGLAGWWELIAILAGICLLLAEIFIIPGFGIAGVLGLLLLFGGLVMVFIPPDSGLPFADAGARWRGLQFGLVSVVIGIVTTGVAMYYLSRHLGTLPIVGRLILQSRSAEGDAIATVAPTTTQRDGVAVGDEGTTITPLRPSGKVELASSVIDVVADSGFIDAGVRVRVVSLDDFRVVVEAV